MLKSIIFNLLSILSIVLVTQAINICDLRGGAVPQASKPGGEYYEKFELDYGSDDTVRSAGSLRGFIKTGKLSGTKEKDSFLSWWNKYLENGPSEDVNGRIKPYYAVDFGTKRDLQSGEHPKVIIVNRKLEVDDEDILRPPQSSPDFELEVREIKSPLLKLRCNFAVRYIVPNRVNIIKILEKRKQFTSDVEVIDKESKNPEIWSSIQIKPTWMQWLKGERTFIAKRQLSSDLLDK